MFQFIFATYSGLALSKTNDRPIAILGLQDRLAKFYGTRFAYGVAQSFLQKSLIWKRSTNKSMKPIRFPDPSEKVPSWSWMAHMGKISYGKLQERSWESCKGIELHPTDPTLKAPLARWTNCCVTPRKDTSHDIRDQNGKLVGWMRYDQEGTHDVACFGCIPLMKSENSYSWKEYSEVLSNEELATGRILIVLLVSGRKDEDIYERVGVAVINSDYVLFSEIGHKI
jgi:hypothetical protein